MMHGVKLAKKEDGVRRFDPIHSTVDMFYARSLSDLVRFLLIDGYT